MKGHSISFFGLCSTRALRLLLGAMFVLLCMPSLASAQAGRGSISGLVSDPSGAVVNGAKVTLLNRATGVEQHTVTSGRACIALYRSTLASIKSRRARAALKASLRTM